MKKIMFSDVYGLTKAVLEGRKTQTRRLLTLTLHKKADIGNALIEVSPSKVFFEDGKWKFVYDDYVFLLPKENYPKYRVGEVIAVAQSYKDVDSYYSAAFHRQHSIHGMTVDALDCVPNDDIKKWFKNRNDFKDKASWNNKMFVKSGLMPHQIFITNVSIQHLQDISNEDCLKEGVVKCDAGDCNNRCYLMSKCDFCHCGNAKYTPREAYASLIDKVSGKGTWDSNPYVWAYDFELVK